MSKGLSNQSKILYYFPQSLLVCLSQYLYGLDFEQWGAQTQFFDFWVWEGMLIPPRGVRSRCYNEKMQLLHFKDFLLFVRKSRQIEVRSALLSLK